MTLDKLFNLLSPAVRWLDGSTLSPITLLGWGRGSAATWESACTVSSTEWAFAKGPSPPSTGHHFTQPGAQFKLSVRPQPGFLLLQRPGKPSGYGLSLLQETSCPAWCPAPMHPDRGTL